MAFRRLRIWKLGSLEHKVFPTGEAIRALAEMLANTIDGGDIDIIWGPDISCEEHYLSDEDISVILKDPTVQIIPSKVHLPDKDGRIVINAIQ
jgi:hypothetical protein